MYRNEQELEREAYLNALARKRIAARKRRAENWELTKTTIAWLSLILSIWLFSILGYAGGAF